MQDPVEQCQTGRGQPSRPEKQRVERIEAREVGHSRRLRGNCRDTHEVGLTRPHKKSGFGPRLDQASCFECFVGPQSRGNAHPLLRAEMADRWHPLPWTECTALDHTFESAGQALIERLWFRNEDRLHRSTLP